MELPRGGGGGGKDVEFGLADATSIYRKDKQQGPAAEHRELHSISCDKPLMRKKMKTNKCRYS